MTRASLVCVASLGVIWTIAGELGSTRGAPVATLHAQVVKDPPELEKLAACLAPITTSIHLSGALYGDEPRLALPGREIAIRLEAIAKVADADMPAAAPAPLPLRDDYTGLTRAELRTALEPLAAASVVHMDHIAIVRRVVERTTDVTAAIAALRGRLEPVAAAATEPAKWPVVNDAMAAEVPECRGVQGIGRSNLVPFDAIFAFYPDWVRVNTSALASIGKIVPSGLDTCEKPVDELATCRQGDRVDWTGACWSRASSARPRNRVGTGCELDLNGWLPPYYTDRRRTVEGGRSAGSVRRDVAEALDGLKLAGAAMAAAGQRFRDARREHVDRFRPQVTRLRAALVIERTLLDAGLARIADETRALGDLHARIGSERASVDRLANEVAADRATIDRNRARLDELAQQAATLRARARATREAMAIAEDKRKAIRLDCKGVEYATCTDERAKRIYDQAVYDANLEVAGLRQRWQEQFAELQSRIEMHLQLQLDTITIQDRTATNTAALAQQRLVLHADIDEAARRSAALARDVAEHKVQREGHDLDDAAVTRVEGEVGRSL
jgi:hypothetical protein